MDGAYSAIADATETGNCEVDGGKDDGGSKMESRKMDIITSIYNG